MTPILNHGGVNEINPILTSNNISSLDDNDIYFSSISSKKNEYELTPKDNPNQNSDNNNNNHQQQQDDLFSTFDFSVLSELSRTGKNKQIHCIININLCFSFFSELQIDGLQLDKYLHQVSLPSPPMDVQNSSISDDSTFYPIDDSSSSTFLWVGKECTVESKNPGDMMVPPSPPLSSAGSSPPVSKMESTKKRSLSTTERKLRKKDQNKSAAEKYRLKKRTEREELMARHSDLKHQNRELKFELENLTFQLEQFKQLFVDILQIPLPSNITQ
jgi:hypothetical protein